MIARKTRYGIALMSALAMISFWATRQQDAVEVINPDSIDIRLDYAIRNFELLFFDGEGAPALSLRSPSFTSDTVTGDGLVHQPVMEVHHEGFIWNIVADSATITDAQDFVHLNGAVLLERTGARPEDWMEIRTRQVALEVNPRIARSTSPVNFRDLSGHMSAIGFAVDMTQNNFQLHNDVQAVYELP